MQNSSIDGHLINNALTTTQSTIFSRIVLSLLRIYIYIYIHDFRLDMESSLRVVVSKLRAAVKKHSRGERA